MNLRSSRVQLANLTRELWKDWQNTREHWLDANSHDFEMRYLEPLRNQVSATGESLEKLEPLIAKLRNECE